MSRDLHDGRPAEQRPAAPTPGLMADDSGAVLIWTILIALPVFFALGAMAVDAHRTYNTFDEAQSFADHTALAAAMELNGQPGAINRAILAACGPVPGGTGPLVTGNHTYGNADAGRALAAGQLVFLSELGTDPSAPMQYTRPADDQVLCTATCGGSSNCVAAADTTARFIEVTTVPVTVDWLIWPVMQAFGVANPLTSADAAARATAGFTTAVCDAAPLFICNPLEKKKSGLNADWQKYRGTQISARERSGSATIAGNYGLLKIAGIGKDDYGKAVAGTSGLPQCVGSMVDTEPGQGTGKVEEGFNAHFDIYEGSMKVSPENPPARHVTNWLSKPEVCGQSYNKNDATPILMDSCFQGGECSELGSRFGKGDWNCEEYWTTTYGDVEDPDNPKPAECTNSPQAQGYTRFDLYKDEISRGNGAPSCQSGYTPAAGKLDRREFIIAVIDCDKEDISGGRSEGIIVREYIHVFLTIPVGEPSGWKWPLGVDNKKTDILFEYIGPANSQTLSDIFKDYPVLYR